MIIPSKVSKNTKITIVTFLFNTSSLDLCNADFQTCQTKYTEPLEDPKKTSVFSDFPKTQRIKSR